LTVEARRANEELEREGTKVRFVRSIFVPESDRFLFLYEGPSVEQVRKVAARAVVEVGRVAEVVDASTEPR
jgi:hypothetical protein